MRPDADSGRTQADDAQSLILIHDNDLEPSSFATSSLVKIFVGPDRKEYSIHRDILVEKSPFFAACLSVPMVESVKNEVDLPEDQCRAFDVIVNWIYSGKVEKLGNSEKAKYSIVKAYQLADKFCMAELQNAIVERLKEDSRRVLTHSRELIWLLRSVPKESTLYKFKWDQLVYDIRNDKERYQDQESGDMEAALKRLLTETEISVELLWALMSPEDLEESPAKRWGCHYHIHGDGGSCSFST